MVARRPSFVYQSLIVILSCLMIFTTIQSLNQFWRLEVTRLPLILCAVGAVAFSWLIWRSPRFSLLLMMVAVLACGIVSYYRPEVADHLREMARQTSALWEHLSTFEMETTFGPALGFPFLFGSGLWVGVITVNEALSSGRAFWSISAGALVMGTEWAWNYDRSATDLMLYVVMALILWVLAQAGRRDAIWLSEGRKIGYRVHVLTPIAGILVVSTLAGILPYEFDPVDLGELGDKAQQIIPALKLMRGGQGVGREGRFSIRSTGFSSNPGLLGGPAQLDFSVTMRATVDAALDEPLYLRGATYNYYTGAAWQAGETQWNKVQPQGIMPTGYASDVPRDYFTVDITSVLPTGRTLFAPLEPMQVEKLKNNYSVDTDGNLWSELPVPKNGSYKVTSRLPRYSSEQIRLLSTASPGKKYDAYLQIPQTLPARVGDFAQFLTRQASHPFDKAVALESVLRQMRYELQVPAAPNNRDFVDYFLFTLRRGYCVYYATTMSVMLRELGIPSRYVEGFAVPPSATSSTGADGRRTYEVSNVYAHAWVEAYFDGYGWVTFDPTPRTDIAPPDRSLPLPTPSDLTTGTDGAETPDGENAQAKSEDERREQNNPEEGGTLGGVIAQNEWSWALSITLALAALVLLAYRRLQLQDRLTASEGRQVVQEAWSKTDALMGRFDFGRRPHQTAQEYATSLSRAWPELHEPLQQVAADYTIARYAPPHHAPDSEAPTRARSLWERLHQALLGRYGWRIYLWRRLRWQRDRKKR